MSFRPGERQHIELALKHLEGGGALIHKDPVKASEKLYEATEEAVEKPSQYTING
ncbi:MAG: PaREP1 family protein [Acidilobaceae archaeon]